MFTHTPPSSLPIRTVYRGDSRHPIHDHVIETGFVPKNPSQPTLKQTGEPNEASRICFSHQLPVASIFPTDKPNDDTWIYILRVPETKDYHNFSKDIPSKIDQEHIGFIGLLYGEEANVKEVPSTQIVGAVRCERMFLGNTYLDGGIFRLKEYVPNQAYSDAKIAQQTNEQMKAMSNTWMHMPVPGNAFNDMSSQTLLSICTQAPKALMYIMLMMQRAQQSAIINQQKMDELRLKSAATEMQGFGSRLCSGRISIWSNDEKPSLKTDNEVRMNNVYRP